MQQPTLQLKNCTYAELHRVDGLRALDQRFLAFVQAERADLVRFLHAYRQGQRFEREVLSQALIDCAALLEHFLAELFGIEAAVAEVHEQTLQDDPIFWFKKTYVLKHAKRRLKEGVERSFEVLSIPLSEWLQSEDEELSLAQYALSLESDLEANSDAVEALTQWCIAAMSSDEGQRYVRDWVSFKLPQRLDFDRLIPTETVEHDGVNCLQTPAEHWRQRDGFDLTDPRMSRRQAMDEVHYCVYCHKNDGDYCSTGFPIKRKQPELGFKKNPLDEVLAGCPLDEKISEMHALKRDGYVIAPLAMVMVDNPMCPATGHRICNDCMKACIYQKQTPVDIPQIETRVLTDALHLPWGVELYDLLTRWNPLRAEQFVAQSYNGKNVLVMGMGPAGFTLAHYLLMAGYAVVGMDGLKIEPVDRTWLEQPIHSFADIYEPLSERVVHGFGGVAEYGITVRWDKNFLKLIYISLMRHQHFQLFGGVRFGGTITAEQAWALGFDHLAIAVGAGLPKELPIENSLAPGMRQANDFLMTLQLTGAGRKQSLANLQVRLPAVVIGGGLTGVDTATEVQAYYLVQIEKIATRYRQLCEQTSVELVRQRFNAHDLAILDEFLDHAGQLAEERICAARENRTIDSVGLIRRFGGVTIAYRRAMNQSPAYRKNHEELAKALEEGLFYAEHLSPERVVLDDYGDCRALVCRDTEGNDLHLAARSIFVATGAKPNVAYAFEHRDTFERDKFQYVQYQSIEQQLHRVETAEHCKSDDIGMFTSYAQQEKRVTFLGDTHPVFHGSVVQAIASGQQCFKAIDAELQHQHLVDNEINYQGFYQRIQQQFNQYVVSNQLIHASVREIVVHAPQARAMFQPGQFYRLQDFKAMEGVACLAASVASEPEQLSLLVFERGVSSTLSSQLNAGDVISLMGPTGVRSKIPEVGKHALVIGGALAIAYLRAIGPALRDQGALVTYIAVFDRTEDAFLQTELEQSCDEVVWVFGDQKQTLERTLREWNKVHGRVALNAVDEAIVIGGPDLLCQVKRCRGEWLDQQMSNDVSWFASVYSPMQCMLKGVCAQCLQWQIDPVTGERTKAVYACSWQHQPFEKIDLLNLEQRLEQNHMQETLADMWLTTKESETYE